MFTDIVSTTIGADGQQVVETVKPVAATAQAAVESETEASAAEEKEVAEADEESVEAEAESSEVGETEEEAESKPKQAKKTGFEKRIEKLNKKATAAEMRAAELEARLNELTKGQAQPQPEAPATASAAEEPKLADFDSYADYQKALYKHLRAQELAEEQKAKAQAAQQAKAESFNKLVADAKTLGNEAFDDFDEVTDFTDFGQRPTPEFYEFISDLEPAVLSKLMYRLGQNRDEFKSILSLSGPKAFRALTKLELEIAAPAKTETVVKVTKAPKPPSTVSGSRSSQIAAITDNMSTDDFRKARMAQLKSRK